MDEKKYVKDGKVRTANAISVLIKDKRYTGINASIAKQLGYVGADGNGDVDALLAACGWVAYVPEVVGATLESAIAMKVAEIEAYDKSNAVKKFLVNGEEAWLEKTDRNSMRNLYTIQQAKEQPFATIWLNGKAYSLVPIAQAIEFLDAIELYAGETNNVTQSHIAYVKESQSVAEAEGFDVTEGYPEIKTFTFE